MHLYNKYSVCAAAQTLLHNLKNKKLLIFSRYDAKSGLKGLRFQVNQLLSALNVWVRSYLQDRILLCFLPVGKNWGVNRTLLFLKLNIKVYNACYPSEAAAVWLKTFWTFILKFSVKVSEQFAKTSKSPQFLPNLNWFLFNTAKKIMYLYQQIFKSVLAESFPWLMHIKHVQVVTISSL